MSLDTIPVEILGQIYFWAGPDATFNTKKCSKYFSYTFLDSLGYTVNYYNIDRLPYRPSDVLKLYELESAIFEPSCFGSHWVNKFYQTYKLALSGIKPPEESEFDLLRAYVFNKSFVKDEEYKMFLLDRETPNSKLKNLHLDKEILNPRMVRNAIKLGYKYKPLTNEEYYKSLDTLSNKLQYAYSIDDKEYIMNTAKNTIHPRLAEQTELNIYLSANKKIQKSLIIGLLRWNRWDLLKIIYPNLPSIYQQLEKGINLNYITFTNGRKYIDDEKTEADETSELAFPLVYLLFKDDTLEIFVTLDEEYLRICTKYSILPIAPDPNEIDEKVSYYILNNHAVRDYVNSLELEISPGLNIENVIYDALQGHLALPEMYYLGESNYEKLVQRAASSFEKLRPLYFSVEEQRVEEVEEPEELPPLDDDMTPTEMAEATNILLNAYINEKFDEEFLIPKKPYKDRDAELFIEQLSKVSYFNMMNVDEIEFDESIYEMLFNNISDRMLSKSIAIALMHLDGDFNNLPWFLDYLKSNKKRVKLDFEAFTQYYNGICLTGLKFLLEIFSAKQVKTLLRHLLNQETVPDSIKQFIATVL